MRRFLGVACAVRTALPFFHVPSTGDEAQLTPRKEMQCSPSKMQLLPAAAHHSQNAAYLLFCRDGRRRKVSGSKME